MFFLPAKHSPVLLRLFLAVNGAVTAVCLLVELLCDALRLPETYTDPFFVGLRFFDFDCFQQRFHLLHTAGFFSLRTGFHFNLLAPAMPLYALFYAAGPGASLNVFLAFSLILFLSAAALFGRSLGRFGYSQGRCAGFVLGAVVLSFPFWFCFQRANIEIVVFALVAGGLAAFSTGRGYLAAGCFALAATLKIVPFLYLALFVSRRQYRQLAFGLLFAAAVTLCSLAWAGPTVPVAWAGILTGLDAFRREYILGFDPAGVGFDHTLLSLYRRFLPLDGTFALVLRCYVPAMAVIGTVLFFTRIRRMPLLNQFLCLCVAAVWLPPVGFEYTLLHLYSALALLLLAGGTVRIRPHVVLIAILVSPLSEFILQGVLFGGQMQSVLLGGLFLLALTRPLPSRWDAAVAMPAAVEMASA